MALPLKRQKIIHLNTFSWVRRWIFFFVNKRHVPLIWKVELNDQKLIFCGKSPKYFTFNLPLVPNHVLLMTLALFPCNFFDVLKAPLELYPPLILIRDLFLTFNSVCFRWVPTCESLSLKTPTIFRYLDRFLAYLISRFGWISRTSFW